MDDPDVVEGNGFPGAVACRTKQQERLRIILKGLGLIAESKVNAPDGKLRQTLFVDVAHAVPKRQRLLKICNRTSQGIRSSLAAELCGLDKQALCTDACAILFTRSSRRSERHTIVTGGGILIVRGHLQSENACSFRDRGDFFG